MPIDPKAVRWDDEPIDPKAVKWDDVTPSRADLVKRELMAPVRDAAGVLRGAVSIGSTVLKPQDWLESWLKERMTGKQHPMPDRGAEVDAALTDLVGTDPQSGRYQIAKTFGELLGTLGVGPALGSASRLPAAVSEAMRTGGLSAAGATGIPGWLARIGGGATAGGAAAGLVNPADAGTGAVIGGALPVATGLAGAAGNAIRGVVTPTINDPALARKAIDQYGIPLGLSDVSKSPIVKGMRSALDDTPLIGRPGARRKEAVTEAFNAAVGDTFGANAPKLTPQIMDAAKTRMGAEFDRLWGQNPLRVDGQLVQDLSDALNKARTKLNTEQAAQVDRQVQELLRKVSQAGDIDGTFANNWQSELRKIVEGEKGLHKDILNDLRQSVIGAFNRSIGPADAAALASNRRQYKAFKTVEPLIQKSEAGVAGRQVGDVPPALLPEAVRKSYGSRIAGSPFADLSQIGSQYVADRVARTGGSPRALVQNMLVGGLSAGGVVNPVVTGIGALGGLGVARGMDSLLSSPALAEAVLSAQRPTLAQLLAQNPLTALSYRAAPVLGSGR